MKYISYLVVIMKIRIFKIVILIILHIIVVVLIRQHFTGLLTDIYRGVGLNCLLQ